MFRKFRILFSKDLTFILRDRKTLYTNILIVLILAPLSLIGIGYFFQDLENQGKNRVTIVGITQRVPTEIKNQLKNINKQDLKENQTLENLKKGEIDLLVEEETLQTTLPQYIIYYEDTTNAGNTAITRVADKLQTYQIDLRGQKYLQKNISPLDFESFSFDSKKLSEVSKIAKNETIVIFLIIYLLIIGLASGGMQYAVELTAGEKERQTIMTTMSQNASPNLIALSKTAVVGLLTIVIGILNTIASITALKFDPSGNYKNLNITPEMFAQIIVTVIPTSLLIATIYILLGILAKNSKEGNIWISFIIIALIIPAIISPTIDKTTGWVYFVIPFLNQASLIAQVLGGYFNLTNLILTLLSTTVCLMFVLWLVIQAFKSEKVLLRQ